jgi:hypothetical protein
MNSNKSLILTSLIIFLIGCNSYKKNHQETSEQQPTVLPVIDLNATFPKWEKADMAELEYIPLETRKDVLIDKFKRFVYISENRIIMVNPSIGDIFVFDGQGKIVSHFNRRGNGPGEYPRSYGLMIYDEPNREIFLFYYNRCLVYSEDGSYLRTLDIPQTKNYAEAYSFDNESLLAFDSNVETDSVYVFLSKKDGSVLSCINQKQLCIGK